MTVSGGRGIWASPGPRRAIIVALVAGAAAGAGLAFIFADKSETSTDDAYVQADKAIVSPKVRGAILQVLVGENQRVKAGDPLARLDSEEFDLAMTSAQGDLLAARAAEKAAQAGLARLDAEEKLSKDQVSAAQALAGTKGAADPALRAAFETARGQAIIAARSRGEIEASLSQAKAAEFRAKTELDVARDQKAHTLVTSPASGVVADIQATPGAIVQPGVRLMTIVGASAPFVVANFKETQIGRMTPGAPAKVRVDALPGRLFTGKVESLSPGAASQFALIPFEPGAGNFTKIVQRVPARIALDPGQPGLSALRAGLSAEVTVKLAQPAADGR
jgi:membrane fusion protein (multidrug efflux system)